MTKHFIKQRQFSQHFLAEPEQDKSNPGFLPASLYLDRISAFETVRAYRGRIFRLDEHLKRFENSCKGLGHALPGSPKAMEAWIHSVLSESGWPDSMIRVSACWRDTDSGVVTTIVRPFVSYPQTLYDEGVGIKTVSGRRSLLRAEDPSIKCSQYVSGVLAFADQSEAGVHEFLFLSPAGSVAEGTVSNIFIVKSKRVLTPSVGSGILSGVTRNFILFLCRKGGWEVSETILTRHDLYNADECFMTNTSSEVLGVVRVDGRVIGAGHPGNITRALHADFKQGLEEMTK